jgi:TIGR03009 family protein
MRHSHCLIAALLLTAVSCTSTLSNPSAKLVPPFKSTPDEEKNVDQLLARWEQWNAGAKTFDCRFKRWCYDTVFGRPDEPRYVELGSLKYAAPDRWMICIDTAEENRKEVPIDPRRADHWLFDGNSITEFDHLKKQVIEHKLPPNLQGKRLVDGPLTFPMFSTGLFWLGLGRPESVAPGPISAKAKDIKEQYYIREITPAGNHDQIWLEAYPRSTRTAAGLHHLQIVFRASDMSPYALKIVQPNEKDYVVYQFYNIAVNGPPATPSADPFHPAVPFGWQKIVEEPISSGLLAYPPQK